MINLDAIQAIAREPQRVADLEWWLALDKEDGRRYCPIARGYTCEEDSFDCIELCHSIWPTLREYDRIQGPCPCKSNIPQVKETFELIVRLRSLQPELVCWKQGMAWVVGVEVPDELAEKDLRLLDGEGNNLQEDGLHELRWPLMNPLGPVTVRWSDATSMEAERCFNASDHRIFKVAKSGTYGRCVVRVTHGNYVVIAPQALSRDEDVGGPAPVAPEDVLPEQARVLAHHLIVEGKREGLVLDGGGPSRIEVRPLKRNS